MQAYLSSCAPQEVKCTQNKIKKERKKKTTKGVLVTFYCLRCTYVKRLL